MISMTGYADTRVTIENYTFQIIIKSWNNRYLDINLQLPSSCLPIERNCRKELEKRIQRGKIECTIRQESLHDSPEAHIQLSVFKQTANYLREAAKAAGIKTRLSISDILAVEAVFKPDRAINEEILWEQLSPALISCIDSFNNDRAREGAATQQDIEQKLVLLQDSLQSIAQLAPSADIAIQQSLRKKFEEVMGDLVDENRILAEIAMYLAKYTINEELVRFDAHLAAFRSAMQEPSCGKKLDFICQELNREANTMGSKSTLAAISHMVIGMKEAIENIREQLRNVE